MKAKRLECSGHVWQAKDKLFYVSIFWILKILINKLSGKRPRGRPLQWWLLFNIYTVNIDLESLRATGVENENDQDQQRALVEVSIGFHG